MSDDVILYVDDEEENLRAFKFLFKRKYNVFTACNAEKAMAILAREEVKIIMTDQRMPDITGSQFLSAVAKKYPLTIRILVSGYSDIEAVIQSVNNANIFKYISKPWDNDHLKIILEQAFDIYNTREREIVLRKDLEYSLHSFNQSLLDKMGADVNRLSFIAQTFQTFFDNISSGSGSIKNQYSRFNLSSREIDVLQLMLQELSEKEISEKLLISKHTVHAHRRNIYKKTNTNGLKQLRKLF